MPENRHGAQGVTQAYPCQQRAGSVEFEHGDEAEQQREDSAGDGCYRNEPDKKVGAADFDGDEIECETNHQKTAAERDIGMQRPKQVEEVDGADRRQHHDT